MGALRICSRTFVLLICVFLTLACVSHTPYPTAPRSNQVDDYHGTLVPDPFRPLEDPDSDETRAWIEAENAVTFEFLSKISARPFIRRVLTESWDYERFGLPTRRGNRTIYARNDGLQNQSVYYVVDHVVDGAQGEPRILLDPNVLSQDGSVAVMSTRVSDDGRFLAYATSIAGSDWRQVQVRNIDTGVDLPDEVEWVKFSDLSWRKDGSGFYYSRYDAPAEGSELREVNRFQKLYFHRLATSQSEDVLVYERKDHEKWGFDGRVTEDGHYLIINVWRSTERVNLVFYRDLRRPDSEVVELIDEFEASYHVIGNDGPVFYIDTDDQAPRRRVIALDTRTPERSNWKELIPQRNDTMRGATMVGDHFVASYLRDARAIVKIFDLQGQFVRDLGLPGMGSIHGFEGRRDDTETFYSYESFTSPGTIYAYDMTNGESRVFRAPQIAFDPADYVTEQVFSRSKDGTPIPIFISYRRGIERDGRNPTILYGYGGFDVSLTPRFRMATQVWLEMGGVYASANLRGGGEYGRTWHEAGMKLHKQNVFDDFIASAEWLIANHYTSSKKLAIQGASNGGLLVGASIVQRPELFGAAVASVGVMDMLRFPRFTIGWAWVSDYGSPDDPEEFAALHAYSPLHNVEDGVAYPATLITTADHDDRVVPAHSFKFAARLQEAQGGDAPVLIRVETRSGHGAGKPTLMRIDEATDVLAFLVETLGVEGLESQLPF